MIEKVIINIEKSWKKISKKLITKVRDSVLITSWNLELPNKRIRSFKREKPLKGTKGKRKEITVSREQ